MSQLTSAFNHLLRPIFCPPKRIPTTATSTIPRSLLRQPPQIRSIGFKMATVEPPASTDALPVMAADTVNGITPVVNGAEKWKPKFVDVYPPFPFVSPSSPPVSLPLLYCSNTQD